MSVKFVGNVSQRFVDVLKSGDAVFVVVIGTTDTSLIPGITIAGASPELTHYTPAADVEFLIDGKCYVIPTPPVTPDGKPTPALISRACILLTKIPTIVVNSGCRVLPNIPYIDLRGMPGRDIRTGNALDIEVCRRIFHNAINVGKFLGSNFDIVILGESIPAGTTTAMAIMVALGFNAWGRVSSASPNNPIELKCRVVREAIRRAGVEVFEDPLQAVSAVGDPVHIALAGLTIGIVDSGCRVLLAGGTQMCAVVSILRKLDFNLDPEFLEIATTRWLVYDRQSDMIGLLSEIWNNYALLISEFSLSESKYPGLKAYDEGFVKEGVGMGGMLVTTLLRGFSKSEILSKVEEEYEKIFKSVPSE